MQATTGTEVLCAFSTIREMLHDRGLDTASLAGVSDDDVMALASSKNVFNVDLPSCSMRIVFNMNPKFKMADVKKLLLVAAPPGAGAKRAAPLCATRDGSRRRLPLRNRRPTMATPMKTPRTTTTTTT